MSTTNELLNELNTRRAAAGKSPLKAWKESKAKIETAIAALPAVTKGEPAIAEGAYENDRVAKQRTGVKPTRKAQEAGKARAKRKQQNIDRSNATSAASILKEFGYEPKQGRALLRRNNINRDDIEAIRTFLKARAK